MKFEAHLTSEQLQNYVAKVFGAGYRVEGIARLHGGAQKVVYKIDCTNGFSCVLYVWDLSQNYFKEDILNEPAFQQSYGGGLFAMNNRYLRQRGIRTPELYDMNRDRDWHAFDYALVEYVHGQKAQAYFQEETTVRHELFQRVGDMLSEMHAIERDVYGAADYSGSNDKPCYELQREHAKMSLEYASRHMVSVRDNYSRLLDKLDELEAAIQPRSHYGLIHGELGPDHILVDDQLQPYLIDIEGAGYFDIEHEHSFLGIRFGEYYRYLENNNLDTNRMAFYRYCHHLSLTSGGLKLLHRNFPDQSFAKGLADYHSRCAFEWKA
ncbi:phosphotransferase family protein [Cohnella yongneupensis]|uniref:Phosphotransferase family protein n=1 Tax=Cohnella yongneupensis TaxID=425006 RepID=A0ABW0QTP9_9BACL